MFTPSRRDNPSFETQKRCITISAGSVESLLGKDMSDSKAYYDGEFFEPYEEECPDCKGTGTDPDDYYDRDCKKCKGEGYCLSYEGERFIQFLKRNLQLKVS